MRCYTTLKSNGDFRRAYGRGRAFASWCAVLYAVRNRQGVTRVGITSSKKIGNAVQRNRARRVIRAALDMVLPPAGVGGWDLVVVARSCTAAQKSQRVAAQLRRLLQQAGLPVRPPQQASTPRMSAAQMDAAQTKAVPTDAPQTGAALTGDMQTDAAQTGSVPDAPPPAAAAATEAPAP